MMSSGSNRLHRLASGDADVAAGVGDDPPRAAVAGLGGLQQVAEALHALARREERQQRGAAGVRLEAAAVAAAADRAVLVDRHVADLAGLAVDAAEQVAADDEPGADRVADADEHRRRDGARASLARLGETAEVRLAVDEDGAADAGLKALGDVDALPAAQEARRGDHAGARIDRRRKRESDGEDVADRAAERLHHVAEQDREPVELGVVPVVERERDRALRHDRAGRIGDRDVQLARAEVHAGDQAELAGERDEGRAAAAARGERRVEQAGCRQLLDDVRHRCGGQAGAAGELDLREPPVPLQRLDKPGSVGFTK